MLKLKWTGAVLAIALATPLAMVAQYGDRDHGGEHPHYLHALRDLQFARNVLTSGEEHAWGPVGMDRRQAVGEIDRAIEELRHAAEMDGRNPNDVPPVEAGWPAHDRLQKASEALGRAREAIGQEEMNPAARMVRDRAFRHIDAAQHSLHHAMDSWH